MIEIQSYKLQTFGRKLTKEQQANIRKSFKKGKLTATSFTLSSKGFLFNDSLLDMLYEYFDLFAYSTSQGDRIFALRQDRKKISVQKIAPYLKAPFLDHFQDERSSFIFFTNARPEDEDDDNVIYDEDVDARDLRGWMPSLMGISKLLSRGDLRPLYLGWLSSIPFFDPEEDDPNELEPPMPAKLGNLPKSLLNLMEFMRIPSSFLASTLSSVKAPGAYSQTKALKSWINRLSEDDCKQALLEMLDQNSFSAAGKSQYQWFERFRVSPVYQNHKAAAQNKTAPSRSVGELIDAFGEFFDSDLFPHEAPEEFSAPPPSNIISLFISPKGTQRSAKENRPAAPQHDSSETPTPPKENLIIQLLTAPPLNLGREGRKPEENQRNSMLSHMQRVWLGYSGEIQPHSPKETYKDPPLAFPEKQVLSVLSSAPTPLNKKEILSKIETLKAPWDKTISTLRRNGWVKMHKGAGAARYSTSPDGARKYHESISSDVPHPPLERIKKFLADSDRPLKKSEILRGAQINPSAWADLIKELKKQGKVIVSGRGSLTKYELDGKKK